jgi:hypothetical protein
VNGYPHINPRTVNQLAKQVVLLGAAGAVVVTVMSYVYKLTVADPFMHWAERIERRAAEDRQASLLRDSLMLVRIVDNEQGASDSVRYARLSRQVKALSQEMGDLQDGIDEVKRVADITRRQTIRNQPQPSPPPKKGRPW